MKFNDTDKLLKDIFDDRLEFGVHKVKMTVATAEKSDEGKEYIEIHIVGPKPDEIEDKARFYFVGGATNISFNEISRIIMHNTPEAKKDAMKKKITALEDPEAMAALLNEVCTGGELWLTKYYDPKRTYTNAKGETKKSVNTNLYGYEPKLKPELMPAPKVEANLEVPFESASDASATVPAKGDWS